MTGPEVWEGQSNPADVANPTEPEGGVTYGTSEVGTAGVVEETGTKELPVKLRGYPSVEDTGPVPRVEAPVPLVELSDADLDSRCHETGAIALPPLYFSLCPEEDGDDPDPAA